MPNLLIPYSLISLLLLGVAIYGYTNASSLSLPLSQASTISTIVLPILAFLNTVFHAARSRKAPSQSSRTIQQQLLPPALQVVQTILTAILGTTIFSGLIPSSTRQCLLSTRWQSLWIAHDATTIRRIQDTLNCCGFNSVRDRAWPFPTKANPQPGCSAQFGRTGSCVEPWTQALQTTSGVEFGVVVAVGLLQLFNFLLVKYASPQGRGSRTGASEGWISAALKHLTGGDEVPDRRNLNRPLLEDGSGLDGDRAVATRDHEANDYHDVDENPRVRQPRVSNGYGSTHTSPAGPRVQPSHQEPSPWAGEEDDEV